MQIWIHDNKMKKIVALNNDISDMLSYTNSSWHSYLDQATSTFDFTIPKFSNGELHEDLKLINDECFVSFYVNGSYQVFYIATLQEDDFNIQLTCNNTNLEYALEYANPFSSESAQTIEWYLNHMDLLSFAAVEIGNNEIPDRKRTLTFDSQETKMNRLQSLMSKFEAEFEFKVELNRDGTYKRIVINIYQEADDTHHGIGTDRKDVVLYYSNGLKGVQVTSDKTQMFNAGVFDGKDGVNLANVEFSEKNADGVEEFYSRKGDIFVYAPLSMQRYPATMRPDGQDNWIRKDFTTEYENVNDLKAYALRTLKKYAYPLVTYTASVQSGFVSHYTDLKLGDTIRIIDKNFVGGLALEARVSEMIISFDNPANNSFVFTNYKKLDNKPSSALQTRIEQAVESKLPYRIELATTGGVTFKNNEGETTVKPSLYKGNLPYTTDVTWHWTLNGIVTDGMQYRIQARDITDTALLTVDAFVGGKKVATTEITFTNVNDGPQGPQGDEGPQGPQGDTGNGIANTVITYGLSMSDTTEPATWSSDRPALVKGMYLWTRTVIIYTNGESTTSYQISYIPQDADASAAIDKTKQELLEKLETVRDDSLAAVEEAKQQLVTVRDESLAAAEEAKQGLAAVNTKVDSTKAELTQTKQQLTTVADDLSKAKTDLQNAVSAVDTKATNLKSDLSQAKQDLTSQAQQLQAQASAQSELTKRVSSVEKTADGTKTTVSELSKTVAQNGKDITSVTNRTKTVEDDLANTKTTLTQVQTTANSASQKTATLETGLDGLSAKFDNLKIGGTNLLLYSSDPWQAPSGYYQSSGAARTEELLNGSVVYKTRSIWSRLAMNWGKHLIDKPDVKVGDEFTYSVYVRTDQESPIKARLFFRYSGQSNAEDMTGEKTITQEWQRFTKTFTVTEKMVSDSSKLSWVGFEQTSDCEDGKFVYYACNKLERGNIATDYSPNEADLEQKVAEYKQTADQNYASLQTTVQNLDGTVQHNKTVAEQTAAGFKTRIESLETYKDGESERANAYFESAKTETAKQLTAERTAIANNYVAKSTYTSDVTGIRNDLSATTTTANTTKTNLANYQASNDRAVANLQSNLQTANGNISSLQTKVEAVPGQITSAVSAVESKIPTSAGGRNLALGTSGDWSGDWTNFNGQNNQTRTIYRIYNRGFKVGDKVNVRIVLKYSDIVAADGQTAKISSQFPGNVTVWGAGELNGGQAVYLSPDDNEVVLSGTTTITDNHLRNDYWEWRLRVDYVTSGKIQWKEAKAEVGDLPTPWSPAPEDTASQISNLSSQIKQTADGITLLATKTELNTAKTELQSGITTATSKADNAQSTANNNAQTISTHTTQISALNTGLQAKVSQSEFNTLSGRVTTAENNITAKANELSSKITSVEGKIPTSVGGRNLLSKTNQGKTNWEWAISSGGSTAEDFDVDGVKAVKLTRTSDSSASWSFIQYKGLPKNLIEPNTQYTLSFDVKPNQNATFTATLMRGDGGAPLTNAANMNKATANKWTKVSCVLTSKTTLPDDLSQVVYLSGMPVAKGNYLIIKNIKLEKGAVSSDWSPAPEDTVEEISNLSSEIKQTADGMTLLATKTELSNAKTELQSGVNTATNKANAAQNTADSAVTKANSAQNKANSNAQTISTHTTQISALNTGLQAKVSQTDFNTLSGRVTNAENSITAKANELSSKITTVEGKIPTSSGGRNLAQGTSKDWSKPFTRFSGVQNTTIGLYRVLTDGLSVGDTIKTRIVLKYTDIRPASGKTAEVWVQGSGNVTEWNSGGYPSGGGGRRSLSGSGETVFELTDKITADHLKNDYWNMTFRTDWIASGSLQWKLAKAERGMFFTDWSPAPEDTAEQISNLSSEIKQTADGMTLLATKTELNSAKSDLQSGITTATNKANTAQSTADSAVTKANAAQSAANNNAQTISTHTTQISALNTGLQAKVSQTDFNTLSGRVTTAENNITAKANELSSKITSVEGKIPTNIGTVNLIKQSTAQKGFRLAEGGGPFADSEHELTDWIKVEPSTVYTFTTYEDVNETAMYYSLAWYSTNNSDYSGWISRPTGAASADTFKGGKQYKSPANAAYAKVSYPTKYSKVKLERGNIATDYNPNPEDYDAALTQAKSEIKQTTDSIKASVSSLDSSTVKSSSLTINADGIVMKAGKSTTDVANAIGSYFAVNQNAINLFSDKINVKGSMIVDGAITSNKISAGAITADKIAANSINSSNIVSSGITANVIKGGVLQSLNGSTNFELDTGKLFYNNNNTGVFRVQDGASTMGLKFSNTSISVNGTSRILSRTILGGDRRETTLDDGKWDKGGFSGVVIETIKGVEPATNEHADAMRVISDNIYFTHTYSADSPTGISAHGWKMETYSPDSSYSGNIVLKPYGINYRQSDIIVGDIRLDNGDGSGYWMRATINVLKACFGHILNGGVSSSALNAIRSELDKISGT